jgi:MFS family permease
VWIKNGHGGAGAWTAILVVSAVGGLAGGVAVLRLRPRRPLLVGSIAVLPNAAPMIVLAVRLPWQVLIVTALVTGFGNMVFNTLWETTLQQHIPPASLSRVSAYDWFGSLLCEPIGVALAAVVAGAIGLSQTLWIAAAVTLVSIGALIAAPSVRRLERLEPELEPSAL